MNNTIHCIHSNIPNIKHHKILDQSPNKEKQKSLTSITQTESGKKRIFNL